MRVIYCVGTATEVGKTWVGAATLGLLRENGTRVAAHKPVQSFDPDDPHPTDAAVLAEATGQKEADVCSPDRSYEVPMAPPMAADALGRVCPTIAELATVAIADDVDLLWVEGVGGPRSPIGVDGDGVDLARALDADLTVLVADAGLGTINAVVSSLDALDTSGPRGAASVIVMLNRYDDNDDLHRRNRSWLADERDLRVVSTVEALAAAIETSSESP